MPYLVKVNYGKWKAGDVVSGGDLKAHTGNQIPAAEKPNKTQMKKLGLTDAKGISDERIDEMCRRGILEGIGEDFAVRLERPDLQLPTFEDRQKLLHQFNENVGAL
jgi:beta-N-acetylglucosaminidase